MVEVRLNMETLKLPHLVKNIRRHLDADGFEELFTPLMVDEVNTEPTLHYFQVGTQYLIGSPELGLKSWLFDYWEEHPRSTPRIYQCGPVFRNQEPLSSGIHKNEFIMAELYFGCKHFSEGIQFFEKLMRTLYPGKHHLPPFPEMQTMTVAEAFIEATGKPLDFLKTTSTWNELFFRTYVEHVEPWLEKQGLVCLTHFPQSITSMAQPSREYPHTVERFEVLFNGVELCNGYQECFDPEIILAQMKCDSEMMEQKRPLPTQWISSLQKNWSRHRGAIPGMCGISIGMDRLAMVYDSLMNPGKPLTLPV